MSKVILSIVLYLMISSTGYTQSLFENNFSPNKSEWPKTDFSKKNIEFSEIISGGPPKDGIPAIDQPRFESIQPASQWIGDSEPVISVNIGGKAKAYPLQILMYHEIINDQINKKFISVTFCPLCNTSIVFDRNIEGKILDFGTTGRLRKSDLIMYDRQTESWWQQFDGSGIIGNYTGHTLEELPSQIISFKSFKENYPNGKVLSKNTGFQRPYGNNPYQGYDQIDNKPFLLQDKADPRLPAMERVISVRNNNSQRIYPFSALKNSFVVNDVMGDLNLVIFKAEDVLSVLDKRNISSSSMIPAYTVFSPIIDGTRLAFEYQNGNIIDKNTSSVWSALGNSIAGKLKGKQLKPIKHGIHFAFAWLAFNPESEIYGRK